MMTLAIGLARWWVRLYTRGLPPEVGDARRAEIESDLWEQGEDATANGSQPNETALQVFVRLLLGIPADLSWRLEQRGAARRTDGSKSISAKGRTVMQAVIQKGLLAFTVLIAAFYMVQGPLMALSPVDWDRSVGRQAQLGLIPFAAGAMILTGLLISKRSPWLGSVLLAVGAVSVAFVWHWMWMVLVPVAVLVIAFAVVRARRFARERDRIAMA